MNEEIRTLIAEADRAIREERFDDLMDFYTDDAVLVISPGRLAHTFSTASCLHRAIW